MANTPDQLVKNAVKEVQQDIYEFLKFLCEKFDDDYRSISISMLKEWRETETQLYGYKALDNIKNDLSNKLRDEGIPFIEYDINSESLSCFVVPALYVQQLETFAIQIAQEKEKVAETTLDSINDYCYGTKTRQRAAIKIEGKEVADRLLQNLTKKEYDKETILFHREVNDSEKELYTFYYPEEFAKEMNSALFQSLWELSCPLSKEIKEYDQRDLKRQNEIRTAINDIPYEENPEPIYIFNAKEDSKSYMKVTKEKIEYSKDGEIITEEHPNLNNDETYENIERWMDSFEAPFLIKENELESLEIEKEKEIKMQKGFFKNKDEYKRVMQFEKEVKKNIERCLKYELNSKSIEATMEYLKKINLSDISLDIQRFEKELTNIKTESRAIQAKDLSSLQRIKVVEKDIEREVEKEIEKEVEKGR